ncbi:unnamed protein product [Adineta steineri]|uniref:Uncharacterized protein n=1 Tax=Adineta steineri TaxID=433720 RepID=A0A815MKD5_9BILA|nr:unnamed protein product [Adineta steineri]CAF3983623.1 unnamed protein product [Adineta steineri]
MQSWSKHQTINVDFQLQTTLNEILSIKDSLMSIESNSIRVSIIDIRPAENFDNDGVTRSYNFVLIGDETGTTFLVVLDLAPEVLKTEYTYDITKIRRKNFNETYILSTTIDTHISLSKSTINPNIDDISKIMNIDLVDVKTIITAVMEFEQQ